MPRNSVCCWQRPFLPQRFCSAFSASVWPLALPAVTVAMAFKNFSNSQGTSAASVKNNQEIVVASNAAVIFFTGKALCALCGEQCLQRKRHPIPSAHQRTPHGCNRPCRTNPHLSYVSARPLLPPSCALAWADLNLFHQPSCCLLSKAWPCRSLASLPSAAVVMVGVTSRLLRLLLAGDDDSMSAQHSVLGVQSVLDPSGVRWAFLAACCSLPPTVSAAPLPAAAAPRFAAATRSLMRAQLPVAHCRRAALPQCSAAGLGAAAPPALDPQVACLPVVAPPR